MKLSEMTLDELWQLFPIVLCPHNEDWLCWYQEERDMLEARLPSGVRIFHIGSTAVETIWAKPIVDILLETEPSMMPAADIILVQNGYRCMHAEGGRRDYNKGYTENGFAQKVFHLHLRAFGDHDELYFRDYLRSHPDVAKAYEALKLSLWKTYEHDRDGYTNAKSNFVTTWTQKAKKEITS